MIGLTVAAVVVAISTMRAARSPRRRVRARLALAADRRLPRPATNTGVWPPSAPVGAGGALVLGITAVTSPALLIVGAAVAVTAPALVRHRRRSDTDARFRRQLPHALDRLATALRSGSSVPTALVAVGTALAPPLGPELAGLGREAQGGRAVAEVLDGWARHRDDTGARLAATALVLASAVGAAPARAVDGVAATLRERIDLAEERRGLGVQARLSALVLTVAPIGFALLLGATDAASARFLFATPAGWACLALGLTLDGLGAWWMLRLTRASAP